MTEEITGEFEEAKKWAKQTILSILKKENALINESNIRIVASALRQAALAETEMVLIPGMELRKVKILNCPNCGYKCRERIVDNKQWFRCERCPFVTSPSQKKIERLYAVVHTQPDGFEGLVAANINGMNMPLINSNVNLIWELIDKGDFDTKDMRVMEFTLSINDVKRN